MNNFISKFIIIVCFISLHILFMPKMSSSANCCTPMSCNRNSSLTNDDIISISFPFRVKDQQPESCGSPGFDMYCDDELGPFIELPKAGNFSVGSIYYYSDFRQIELSDADDCLPRKLLNLDLTTTPLRVISQSKDFKVYNCSGFGKSYALHIEKIDCLSGSNYTVISASGSSSRVTDSDCRFLKDVSVPSLPTFDRLNSELSSYSSIYLTWDEQTCTLQRSNRRTWLIAITILVCIVIGVSCVLFIWLSTRNDERRAAVFVTTSNTSNVVSPGQSSTRSNLPTSSLDQITINSYPMVVIGQSRRLIKPHDDKCPICLTDYVPGDTLKILPDCLHRFHVACIDLWLSSKCSCPICRISPPHNNS